MPAFDAEEMQLLQELSEIPYLLDECVSLQISLVRLGMSSKDMLAETQN